MRLPSETKQQLFLKNLFSENGLLYTGTGIFLAVAGTQTTEQAFFLSSICLTLILINCIASSIAGDIFQYRIPLRTMVIISSIILAGVAVAFSEQLTKLPENSKILLFLLSVSPLVYSRSLAFSHTTSLGRAVFDAAGQGCGVLLAMFFIAIIREFVGQGSLGGTLLFRHAPWQMISAPMGGMIITAFAVIAFRLASSGKGKK
jgi:Na+-translocating ferredoxin:NAD+ oxidoreductase RnfE subunit